MKALLNSTLFVVLMVFVACNGSKHADENITAMTDSTMTSDRTANQGRPAEGENLTRGQWDLTELGGLMVSDSLNQKPFIMFTAGVQNRVSGFSGCNRFSGSFELTGANGIRFSQMVSTKMACPSMDVETKFLDAVQSATNWTLNIDDLSFSNGSNVTARFRRAEVPAEK